MSELRAMLESRKCILADGAMGTMLQQHGLQPGECPELWCVEQAAALRSVHDAYCQAGSEIIETNSFGGSRFKLEAYGLGNRVTELNRAAASLARQVAGSDHYVLASVGPTGQFMEPLGPVSEMAMYEAFAEQIVALEAGGADAVVIETMTALDEAMTAVRAARENTRLLVFVSFTFDPQHNGGYATMMGVHPEEFAFAAKAAGADVIGTNCGTGPETMVEIVELLHAAVPELPLCAMPNAGMPQLENGVTVFRDGPDIVASAVPRLVKAGATVIGGCCGTTPDHIRAMRRMIDQGM